MESKQVVQAEEIEQEPVYVKTNEVSIDLYSEVLRNYDYSLTENDSNTDSEGSVSELKIDGNGNENNKTNAIFNSKDMNTEETDSSEVSDISEDDNSEGSESEEMSISENIKVVVTDSSEDVDGDESDSSEESNSDGSDSSEDTDSNEFEIDTNVNIINSSNNIETNSNDTNTDVDLDTEMYSSELEDNNIGINHPIPELNKEEDDTRLHPEQLELLEKSEKIREFLKDDFLREIILEIDHAARNNDRNVECLLDNGKKNDEMFYNFTEEILNIIYGHPKIDF